MPTEKLTAAQVAQHYNDRYAAISHKLDDWEQAKAAFLVEVGKECLALIRHALDPLPEHDLTGRKAARAQIVKEIEEQLPSVEGIGAPQVNRWIRWAGTGDVICVPDDLTWPGGLKQAHLMVLEKFIEQHEPTATFRLKEPWKNKLDEVQEFVRGTLETGASARELEEALDAEAEFPKAAERKEERSTLAPKSEAPNSKEPAGSSKATTASEPKHAPTVAASPAPTLQIANPKPAPSPASSSAPAPSSPTTSKDLADQAFKLLQQPEILAGVFRREWEPDLVLAIVENLIRASGEKSKNPLALAKAYHRMKAVVLTHFEEYVDGGKFKLRKKEQPEAPTLEQLAPELATA